MANVIQVVDGMAKVTQPGQRACGECGKPTWWYLLWADGRATWPACEGCKTKVRRQIERDNGEWACVVGWRKYPEK
jgi:hypothetical protein